MYYITFPFFLQLVFCPINPEIDGFSQSLSIFFHSMKNTSFYNLKTFDDGTRVVSAGKKTQLENVLFEFPLREVRIQAPSWLTSLDENHWLGKENY